MGGHFGFVARLVGADLYCESRDTFGELHNLVETPLEGCCDVYVHEESSGLDCFNLPIDNSMSCDPYWCGL